MGERLPKCDADQVKEELADGLSRALQNVIRPLLKSVEAISEQIAAYDKKIGEIAKRYPEVELLTPVYGVGTLIALTYILTIEDAQRFGHSRDVGPFLGLQPKQRDSGNSQPQLGISKTGDRLLRSLLVQGAHCILRKGAPESDIRAWGLSKIGSGGKNAKRRTVVAVARKLAVLLHTLWANGEVYDPLYNRKAAQAGGAKAAVKTAA
jgi:transposase